MEVHFAGSMNKKKRDDFTFPMLKTEKEMLELIDENTDIVYIETPTNPMMVKYNIEKIANKAQAYHAKVIVVNTFLYPNLSKNH